MLPLLQLLPACLPAWLADGLTGCVYMSLCTFVAKPKAISCVCVQPVCCCCRRWFSVCFIHSSVGPRTRNILWANVKICSRWTHTNAFVSGHFNAVTSFEKWRWRYRHHQHCRHRHHHRRSGMCTVQYHLSEENGTKRKVKSSACVHLAADCKTMTTETHCECVCVLKSFAFSAKMCKWCW